MSGSVFYLHTLVFTKWALTLSFVYPPGMYSPTTSQKNHAPTPYHLVADFWSFYMIAINMTIYLYLADPGKARGCSTNSFVTYSLSDTLVKISLCPCHGLVVGDVVSSHKMVDVSILAAWNKSFFLIDKVAPVGRKPFPMQLNQ